GLLCYWAVKELGISGTTVAKKLGITQPAASKAVQRGEKIALDNNFRLVKEGIL
ncbi:MAG: LysR family transcriptional regulator, partial [Deltaproteobacteria bacterium]|nr:LysR family transcriptional regulator [Deltaproteobacteria bacterium]MBW1794980.1 LysR family transcriptional regulator [Deltaproteobacteria bacterium]